MSCVTLPTDLAALIAAGGWPKGHFPASRVLPLEEWTISGEFYIDLYGDAGGPPPHDFDLQTMRRLGGDPRFGTGLGLALGSRSPSPIRLPLLDVEQVICIAGGAQIGDDLWVALDFRTHPDAPRVVANRFLSHHPIATEWRIIADTWQDFLGRLTG